MKEKVKLASILVLFLVFLLPLITSVNQTAINNGYQCLEDEIEDRTCDQLSVTEKIFSVLALDECRTELKDEASSSEGCWPAGDCDIKTTSQAIWALGDSETTDAQDWLLSQNKTPEEITWYLQIDSLDTSTCTITYGSNPNSIEIGEDKKLSSGAGSCLTLSDLDGDPSTTADNDYWLEVSNSCYENEFEISCDQGFVTNLLFKKQASPTIHVLEDTTFASAEGTTTEKVNSFCFADSAFCDYEGSLWAVLILDSLGEDVVPYLPYLLTMMEENENDKFLPESFLYALTGGIDFYAELTSKQSSGYWQVSGDKYYDTALAIYTLQNNLNERENVEEALLNDQQASGCWDSNNILNTAFILHSLSPRTGTDPPPPGPECITDNDCSVDYICSNDGICVYNGTVILPGLDCENSGYYCISNYECTTSGGTSLDDYSCIGTKVCCNSAPQGSGLCADLNGEICSSGKTCSSSTVYADDTSECCLDDCIDGEDPGFVACESAGGICEPVSCGEGYTTSYDYTCDFSDTCCFIEPKSPSKPSFWLWFFIVLIVLSLLAILFRNQLKNLWLRLKTGSSRGTRSSFRPGGPRSSSFPSVRPRRRIMPRRIIPSSHRPASPHPRSRSKIPTELDHVLDKLKKMGNK